MAANYWVKTYTNVLENPTIATLDDRLWRRYFELNVLAGKVSADRSGVLPPLKDIAWHLRQNIEQLEDDCIELQRCGLLAMIDGKWTIPTFAEEQAPSPASVRMQEYRKRKQNDYVTKRNENVTKPLRKVLPESESESESEAEADTAAALSSKDAGTFQERWTQRFLRDYFESTGETIDENAVNMAVQETIEYIARKDYPMKYQFAWIEERVAKQLAKEKQTVDIGPYLGR
jgi:hypothetical protein